MPPKKQNKRGSPEPSSDPMLDDDELKQSEESAKRLKAAADVPKQSPEDRQVDGQPKVTRVNDLAYLEQDANEDVKYMRGFGGHFSSEALEGALPEYGNAPKRCPYGLIAEQLSGTSFTTPRVFNQRTWLYRIRPTVAHEPFKKAKGADDNPAYVSDFAKHGEITPNQLRWKAAPFPAAGKKVDWVQGLRTVAGSGSPDLKAGLVISVYTANASMVDKAFVNSDGDLLIVPQEGALRIQTEFGIMNVRPHEFCVIQRGMRFTVSMQEGVKQIRGYMLEVFNNHFRLPDLGPIGSNGLANPRDFKTPVAAYENRVGKFRVVHKFMGEFWTLDLPASPYDVVAWHGNYAPYKYNLMMFNTVNTVSYDHMDPSIFTVLTCPSNEPGVAAADFVVFPPRWIVQEDTFKPPYYHRNTMSEYMGNVCGKYEAKPTGFVPGGGSLHSCMIGHGPDFETFLKGSAAPDKNTQIPADCLAFMFESTYMFKVTPWALQDDVVDADYYKCWKGLETGNNFTPHRR